MEPDKKPEVDILMATYNGEKYLDEQIQSILNQSNKNFRLIVSDDCSKDGTRNLLLNYAEKDKRINLIFQESNKGVIKNFETLIELSTADYFMLSDQDDVWHRDKVRKSIEAIRLSKAMLVYTNLKIVDENLKELQRSYWIFEGIKPLSGSPWKLLLSQNIVTGCTIIAERRLKNLALPFPTGILMHDSWLAFAASIHGSISYINEPLVSYRQHSSNQIGSQGYLTQLTNRTVLTLNYQTFYNKRKQIITEKINLYQSYLLYLKNVYNNKEYISRNISILLNSYKYFRNVKYIDPSLGAVKLKFQYPSEGVLRNLWWVLLLNYPLIIYIILKGIKFIRKKED